MKKFIPIGPHVLVKVIEESDKKSASSLYVPEEKETGTIRAKVIAANDIPSALVAIGHVIYIPRFTGFQVTMDGEDFLWVKDEHILGYESEKCA